MACKWLTEGNTKLLKFGGVSFDLPARKTCPKAGECAEICYAAKLARIYKGYAAKVERNWDLSRGRLFTLTISEEIEEIKPHFLRIHGGGDFYNQRYLNKWLGIVKDFRKTEFYAYTKSLHLDFGKHKNLTIIKSFGGKLDNLIGPRDYRALIIPKHSEPPKGYVLGNENDLWWINAKKCALRKH